MPTWLPEALYKYAVFEGRARRREYWYFVLFLLVSSLVLLLVDSVLGTTWVSAGGARRGVLQSLFALAMFVPCIAVTARRLHDTDRSGWWQLIGLVPIAGFIVMLIFTVSDSQPGTNRFGPNPKDALLS